MGRLTLEFFGRRYVADISDTLLDRIFNVILREAPQTTWRISSVSEAKIVTARAEAGLGAQETKIPSQGMETTQQKVRHEVEIPSEDEVYQYIKSQPDYEHSFKSVAEHFLGYVPMRLKGGRKEYDRLWNRIKAARQRIASEENGRWQTETVEGRKVYRFVPDSE